MFMLWKSNQSKRVRIRETMAVAQKMCGKLISYKRNAGFGYNTRTTGISCQ